MAVFYIFVARESDSCIQIDSFLSLESSDSSLSLYYRRYPSCLQPILLFHSLSNRRFPSCLSPLFQSGSWCEAFHMEISFIHMLMNQNLRVNKTNFHTKGFALGLALEQRRKATRKSPIQPTLCLLQKRPVHQLKKSKWNGSGKIGCNPAIIHASLSISLLIYILQSSLLP